MAGIWQQLLLTRANDDLQHRHGQDGGFVSAMLIWLLEHDYIEAAMVSGVEDDDAWKAKPVLVHNREEVIATAGSRYTYCANPLALRQAKEEGLSRLALVGMGCQTSSPPTMWDRKAGKVSKPFVFNIGLLCSKTFDDAIFTELFEAKYGLPKSEMVKMNIKGVFQIWMRDGSYHEIDLKECHAWTPPGLQALPRLRRRARRHLARRDRQGQRLDADDRAHRSRRRGRRADDRRRHDPRQAGAGRRGGDEAAAHPVDRVAPALAGRCRPGTARRCAAAEEEGRRGGGLIRPRWSQRRRRSRGSDVADGAEDAVGSDEADGSRHRWLGGPGRLRRRRRGAALARALLEVGDEQSHRRARLPRIVEPLRRIPVLVLVGDRVELVVGVALELLQHARLLRLARGLAATR